MRFLSLMAVCVMSAAVQAQVTIKLSDLSAEKQAELKKAGFTDWSATIAPPGSAQTVPLATAVVNPVPGYHQPAVQQPWYAPPTATVPQPMPAPMYQPPQGGCVNGQCNRMGGGILPYQPLPNVQHWIGR
jgi:hypothetical protein